MSYNLKVKSDVFQKLDKPLDNFKLFPKNIPS